MSANIYKDPNRFYVVYAYYREDGTPYYIGKGSCGREKSQNRIYKPPSDKSRIVIIKKDISESEAFDLEKELIKLHGRKDKGTGILRNLTDGGEGASGAKRSDVTKRRMSLAQQSGEKHYLYGKNLPEETKRKLSEARKGKYSGIENHRFGKPVSSETKLKLSEATSGVNHYNYGKKLSDETK